jgi:hypothetical protein
MNTLKEWATVVSALESGDQVVLLRKGGILEAASGFVMESKRFFLFPTFEHQVRQSIKPEFHKYLEFVKDKQLDGKNTITSFADVLAEVDLTSEEGIKKLSEFHIWSESYVKTRIGWMPQKALKAIFLKTYKMPAFVIPLKPEYQGCKSWININANFDDAKPVLDDAVLESRLQKFREIVN